MIAWDWTHIATVAELVMAVLCARWLWRHGTRQDDRRTERMLEFGRVQWARGVTFDDEAGGADAITEGGRL